MLLCISTERATLADSINRLKPPKEIAERRTKRAHASGRSRELGRFSENLPNVGDVKNDTAGLWVKGNLRVKRRDPWFWLTHRYQRWLTSAEGLRRGNKIADVS